MLPSSSPVQGRPRALPWLLMLGGAAGLGAAMGLTVEKMRLLHDPSYVPSCSINPVLSCGSVMSTPQAEAFGIPNSLLGIVGFAIVTTVGAALLAGAELARWFWLGLQLGVTFGVGFVHWLIFQSLYRIGALCPYCLIVWAVTIPIFWYVTLHNLRRVTFHAVVMTSWYVIILALITERFWDYWSTRL
ncbi:vitamin K epoxide reductase family protein [Kribbella sp. NPDC000426]|uniref:vitamin K epoxide reductase family protein n=1 Tax=Kribbella sp. NPDC000426 TaxID=3154255 RepID=UPI00331E4308